MDLKKVERRQLLLYCQAISVNLSVQIGPFDHFGTYKPFDHKNYCRFARFQPCYSPANNAREVIEASKDAESLALPKKKLGTFGFEFFGSTVTSLSGLNDLSKAGDKNIKIQLFF